MQVASTALAAALVAVLSAAAPATNLPTSRDGTITEVVVTATRAPRAILDVAASISRVDAATLNTAGTLHYDAALNQTPGVYVQRGSGQEGLLAVRSPVLTGAGACGAFLVLEDGMSTRPVGFCNVNELFELNTEQAAAAEVLRGPGTHYGANALHGVINVLTPRVAALPALSLGWRQGAARYRQVQFQVAAAAGDVRFGAYGSATHDGGFRAHSSTDNSKLNLLLDRGLAGGELQLRAAATVLNQDTAGFIRGLDSYRNTALARSNPNPEAYRNASSARFSGAWERNDCGDCELRWQWVLRRSRMEFMQHFLLGKPIERNAQSSAALAFSRRAPLQDANGATLLVWGAGAELEYATTTLLEFQTAPTTEGSAAARAIRPAGRHYDYGVNSLTASVSVAADWPFAARWTLAAGGRGDLTRYQYNNRMRSGNTNEFGVACPFGGCLFSRPASRADRFAQFTPHVELRFRSNDRQLWYATLTRGFRPPESTELYRLQRQQNLANLNAEQLDSAELGWRLSSKQWSASLAAYAMRKRNVIVRDASGFNIDNLATAHRGLEYQIDWRLSSAWKFGLSGTIARHEYRSNALLDGGETIRAGRDIDTAPRQLLTAIVGWTPTATWQSSLRFNRVGPYYLDAANSARYPGHTLVDWQIAKQIVLRRSARLQLELAATNLLDRTYATRADIAFGDYRYLPGPGRSFFAGFKFEQR